MKLLSFLSSFSFGTVFYNNTSSLRKIDVGTSLVLHDKFNMLAGTPGTITAVAPVAYDDDFSGHQVYSNFDGYRLNWLGNDPSPYTAGVFNCPEYTCLTGVYSVITVSATFVTSVAPYSDNSFYSTCDLSANPNFSNTTCTALISGSFTPVPTPAPTTPTVTPTTRTPTAPTIKPTVKLTAFPTTIPKPTRTPTRVPTAPTLVPTLKPTTPTIEPTTIPTFEPTLVPSNIPTNKPSISPSFIPTIQPTVIPTVEPTFQPSKVPTVKPTSAPSNTPTDKPSISPSFIPTIQPTVIPTVEPTFQPSKVPTVEPTLIPSNILTDVPSILPTLAPTVDSTVVPTLQPTEEPTSFSANPTVVFSIEPTRHPTSVPSEIPTYLKPPTPPLPPHASNSTKPRVDDNTVDDDSLSTADKIAIAVVGGVGALLGAYGLFACCRPQDSKEIKKPLMEEKIGHSPAQF